MKHEKIMEKWDAYIEERLAWESSAECAYKVDEWHQMMMSAVNTGDYMTAARYASKIDEVVGKLTDISDKHMDNAKSFYDDAYKELCESKLMLADTSIMTANAIIKAVETMDVETTMDAEEACCEMASTLSEVARAIEVYSGAYALLDDALNERRGAR